MGGGGGGSAAALALGVAVSVSVSATERVSVSVNAAETRFKAGTVASGCKSRSLRELADPVRRGAESP